MDDIEEKQLKLDQEINYKKQIFLQHRSSLQDAHDNLVKLRSYIHLYNTTIEKVTKEEEHDSNNATNNTLKSMQIKSKIDSKDSLKQQIDSTELIIKQLKSELIIATQHFHSIKTNTTTAASNINNGNIIRAAPSPSASMSQYDNSNSNSTSLIPTTPPSSSSSSSATSVEQYLHIRQQALDLTKAIDEKETELISLSKQYDVLSNEITQLINTTTAAESSSIQPPATPGIDSLLSTGAGSSMQYYGGYMMPINIHPSSSSSAATATATIPSLSPTNTTANNNNTNNTYTSSSKTPSRGAWVLEGTLSLMDVLTGKIQVYSLLV